MKHLLAALALVTLAGLSGCLRQRGNALEQQLAHASRLNKDGDLDGALVCLNQAAELAPESPTVLVRRASVRSKLGDMSGALIDVDKAIELEPEYPTAYLARGVFRRETENLNGSLEDLDRAVALAPRVGEMYLARGQTKADMGDLSGAIEDFTLAADRDPKLYRAYLWRAYAYVAANREDLALRDVMHVCNHTKEGPLRERAESLRRDLLLSRPPPTD